VSELGKFLVAAGLVMVIVGAILLVTANLPGKMPWLGRLPGDIRIERGHWSVYVPLTTSILISLLLTLVLSLLRRR
jgi:hypothetical protein